MIVRGPVLINCRDRVTPLRRLVRWLEEAGHDRIYLIDNDSTWAPLLEYYETTPHTVVHLRANLGSHGIWDDGVLHQLGIDGSYVVTDPDVVPTEDCPLDALERLSDLLTRYPEVVKAGLGLRIDDLPPHARWRQEAIDWEAQFWMDEVEPGVFRADIDTTFALYRAPGPFAYGPALRTGPPYVARHTPWYLDYGALSEEDSYYRAHARPDQTNWDRDEMREDLAAKIADQRTLAVVRGAPDLLSAWMEESTTADEQAFTPWAEPGWSAWNDMSPEVEICDFAGLLARLLRPETVLETGVGQGYMTRRIASALGPGQVLVSFETDPELRQLLARLPFFQHPGRVLSERCTPSDADFATADLTILDCDPPMRRSEIERWFIHACEGATLLVHDTGNGHGPTTIHSAHAKVIRDLGIPGWFLKNPRGAFLGYRPSRDLPEGWKEEKQSRDALEAQLSAIRATRSYRVMEPARRLLIWWNRLTRGTPWIDGSCR